MDNTYSDEQLFLGKNAFYFIAFGLFMLMDPIYTIIMPLFTIVAWLQPLVFVLGFATLLYFLFTCYTYVFTTTSKGDYVFTVNTAHDEYYDSVKSYAYQCSFNINVVLIFTSYIIFKIPQLEALLTLEEICKFFVGTLCVSYGGAVYFKLKRDEHDE